jgi:hypothetical protein
VREARLPLIAAIVAGFGAGISEVGAAMMVGGNIKGETRVLTTATVLEVSRGHFETALPTPPPVCVSGEKSGRRLSIAPGSGWSASA